MKLITEFAEKISEKLVHNGIVPKEDASLYQYGIENAITVAGNLLASVTFGIITGRLGVVLVFLFFYGTLRSFSGGVHCKSKAGCFCLSMAILLFPIYTSEWIMGIVNKPVLIIIGIIAVVTILILSPVESINKPLDDEERRFYRRVSHCIVALQVCILAFLFCLGKIEYFYAGYGSLILVAVFMVIGEILTKRYI